MKSVVIIGGGFAGTHAAKKLENHFSVTLIDSKDYFEFTPSVLRTLVEPMHIRKMQALHTHYLHKTHVVRACVQDVTSAHVVTDKESFSYDYLVIASGSSYSVPIKEKELVAVSRTSTLRSYANKVKDAKSILIVGGGLVGVELAAELATHFSTKKITLVHSQKELIERNPKQARRYAKEFLEKRGVHIFFSELFTEKKNGVYRTNKGTKIQADLVFLCTGIVPQSSFLQKHFKTALDTRGFVQVNAFLQLKNTKNIFVAGDVNALQEEKTAQNAEKQGRLVAENIKRIESHKKLEPYTSKPRTMVISLGKWDGILIRDEFVLTGIIPGLLKSFIEWKEMQKYK